MFRKPFVFTLIVVLILVVGVYGATAQEPHPQLAGNAGCAAGSEYDPNCDVNRDGDMTVEDLSLVANHWGQAGVWTAAGDFWNLNGNTVADEAEAWVGTWNEHPIVFKTNGVERLRITTADKLIIGRNTIVIDNQNDTITASSGTLSFDDENLVTMGNVGIGLPRSVPPERLLHLRRSIGEGGLYQRIEAEDRPAYVGIEFASRGTVESIIQMNTS